MMLGWPKRQRRSASRRTVCLSVLTSLLLSSPAGKLISLDDGGVGVGGEGIINEERGASERAHHARGEGESCEGGGEEICEGEGRRKEGENMYASVDGSLLAPNGNARSAAPARMATAMPFVATLRRLRLPTNQPELRLSRRAAAAAGQASASVHTGKRN